MNQKELVVPLIAFTFIFAIIFLMAFAIVLTMRRRVFLITAIVASSFLLGTFVAFNPGLSRRLISPLARDDSRNFNSFGEQVIAAIFRSPENLAQAIVVGSLMFGFSAAVWGFLFWRADRKSGQARTATLENTKHDDKI